MIPYHLRTALSNLRRNVGIHLLTVFSIAVGLFLILMTVTAVFGLNQAVREWTSGFGMVAYLTEGLPQGEEVILGDRLRNEPGIRSVTYVSPEAALEELKRVLGEDTLDGIEENPLPGSFKLGLSDENLDASRVRNLAQRIRTMEGISDVQYGEKWVERMALAADRISVAGSALGLSLGVGILFILSNTIKILYYRRAQEIEILKLLGATRGFIRAPFLIEGIIFGILSGVVAASGTVLISTWLASGYGFPMATPWPPTLTVPLVVVLGGTLGIVGSFLSLGRIRL